MDNDNSKPKRKGFQASKFKSRRRTSSTDMSDDSSSYGKEGRKVRKPSIARTRLKKTTKPSFQNDNESQNYHDSQAKRNPNHRSDNFKSKDRHLNSDSHFNDRPRQFQPNNEQDRNFKSDRRSDFKNNDGFLKSRDNKNQGRPDYRDRDESTRPRRNDRYQHDSKPYAKDGHSQRSRDKDNRQRFDKDSRQPYNRDGKRDNDSRQMRRDSFHHDSDNKRPYRSRSNNDENLPSRRPHRDDRQNKPWHDDKKRDFRPNNDKPYADKRNSDRPYRDKPYQDRSYRDRSPDRSSDRSPYDNSYRDRQSGDRPYRDKPYRDRSSSDRPFNDKPYRNRQSSDRSYENKYDKKPYSNVDRERSPRDQKFEDASSYDGSYNQHSQDFVINNQDIQTQEGFATNQSFDNAANTQEHEQSYQNKGDNFHPSFSTPSSTMDARENRDKWDRPHNRSERGGRDLKRLPLRETIMNMDRDLLKVLARRCNILGKMKVKSGYLEVKEEKEIRASWEKSATKMTRDPRIIHQLFALMQEITFSAKPSEDTGSRSGYNLAPLQLPVNISMHAPLVSRHSRLFLAMAGACSSALRLSPSLLDDATVECIKMFNQCATSLAWDDDGTLIARAGGGLSLPDKVIFVGDDLLNFFLLLGHYVGKNTRAKFTGESNLKQADLTAVRSFLPQLGARLSNVMPNSFGFPIRLECSGILPQSIVIPENIPADCVLGLLLAAPFWEFPISFDLNKHPQATEIIDEALFVLNACKAEFQRKEHVLNIAPCTITTPAEPKLGVDLHLTAYILALPLALGGNVHLDGLWPSCPQAKHLEDLFQFFGLNLIKQDSFIQSSHIIEIEQEQVENSENISSDISDETGSDTFEELSSEELEISEEVAPVPLENLTVPAFDVLNDVRFQPLFAACTLILALRNIGKKHIILPREADVLSMESFFNHFGFELINDGFTLSASTELGGNFKYQSNEVAWTASTPAWALAFALVCGLKPHNKLSNPGIMTGLYPQFWNLYNALPSFKFEKKVTEQKNDKPVRRRIIAADQEGTRSGDSPNRDNA